MPVVSQTRLGGTRGEVLSKNLAPIVAHQKFKLVGGGRGCVGGCKKLGYNTTDINMLSLIHKLATIYKMYKALCEGLGSQ